MLAELGFSSLLFSFLCCSNAELVNASDIYSSMAVSHGARVAASLAFGLAFVAAGWPTRMFSCAHGLCSTPILVHSCFGMLCPMKPNQAKIMLLSIVTDFALVPCWNGSFCCTVVAISSQSKGTTMARALTSWDCHITSGCKYICWLGKLKLLCHFFEIRCIPVGSGKNKYQYLKCAVKSNV